MEGNAVSVATPMTSHSQGIMKAVVCSGLESSPGLTLLARLPYVSLQLKPLQFGLVFSNNFTLAGYQHHCGFDGVP